MKLSIEIPWQSDVKKEYAAFSRDSRYAHFVRIPERICRCLDYFHVTFNRAAVKERLHAYYLFIGVVDEVLDSARLEAGQEIIDQLFRRDMLPATSADQSPAWLVTEVLKDHIEAEVYSAVKFTLEELYQAVFRERNSRTLARYVADRRIVGKLTAEVSYLLILPLLERGREDLRCFLRDVGEVGCLVDSSIDLRADHRLGLLSFTPTLMNHLQLVGMTLHCGMNISLRHPRLFGLFLEAMADNCLDQLRSITGTGAANASEAEESFIVISGSAPETLSSVAWTKP